MTDESPSADVGRASIDAYLESVEGALLAANAPRGDRLQVLQDLESQIADMLSQQPPPLTEETVQSVIARLEAPSHFAETYGTPENEIRSPRTGRSERLSYNRWVVAAAVSFVLIPLGCLLLMVAAANGPPGPAVAIVTMFLLVGCVLTPIALWNGVRQLRTEPGRYLGSDVVLGTMTGYISTMPLLLLVAACVATQGYFLFLLGIGAFAYFQYWLVRRARRSMTVALSPTTAPGTRRDTSERQSPSPASFSNAMTMAAI